MSSDVATNMITAAADQDWATLVDYYDEISPIERGELALWITGQRGDLRDAPQLILDQVGLFASVAILECGLRWSNRNDERESEQG